MPLRKAKRTRRPAIETAEQYDAAWKAARYLERGGKSLTRDDFHRDRFDNEDELRALYESDKAAFAAMPQVVTGQICRAGCRHELWWKFDSPERRDETTSEAEQLDRLGLLTGDEIEALKNEAEQDNERLHFAPHHNGLPFRRPWAWWRFASPEPRDPATSEAEQLIALGVLTTVEQAILDDPLRAVGLRKPTILPHRTRFYYLPAPERELLGLNTGHALKFPCDCPAPTSGAENTPFYGRI